MSNRFVRREAAVLAGRLAEPRRFIQIVLGPRQVGKSTLVRDACAEFGGAATVVSADEPTLRDATWLERAWQQARRDADVLVIDEVQKVTGWSEVVKRLWDEDTTAGRSLRVVLLGSAPLLVRRGLSESLAGRFETIPVTHWSFEEMRGAFGWDVDEYVFAGGYPGAATLVGDHERWVRYVRDSLIETTIARDVLLLTRIDKPALLRRLFDLACRYTGQVLSYTKLVGQLQDAGNTTTLAHYLDVLDDAGMLAPLQKFAGEAVRRRGSSPKLLVRNTALASAIDGRASALARADGAWWGRLTESAVGAHLANEAVKNGTTITYWRQGDREVDFVVEWRDRRLAIEVKSARGGSSRGLDAFRSAWDPDVLLVVGADGVPLGDFLATPSRAWFDTA